MSSQVLSRRLGPCLVCDAPAIGINFTVPTCAPCKAFFRRNAVKLGTIEFVCQEDGDCSITWESRRMCNCCRLAKCFRVGMQRSLIRTDEEREARKELVLYNRKKRNDLKTLQSLGLLPSLKRLRTLGKRSDYLTESHQMLLTNVIGAYEQACENVKIQNLYFPQQEHTTPHTFFNEYHNREVTLIEYFKIIPEFNRLSIDDKVRLIRNHVGTMYYINEPILAQFRSNKLVSSLHNSFHIKLSVNMLHSMDLMYTYANDPLLLKLVLIVRSLSSSINRYRNDVDMDRVFDDTRAIFLAQSVYVELLWRYILYRTSSEREAVKFLNKLIMDILFIQHTCLMADYYLYSLKDEIDQLEPLMRSMWPISNQSDARIIKDINMSLW